MDQQDPEKGITNGGFEPGFENNNSEKVHRITYTWKDINVWTPGGSEETKSCFGLKKQPPSKHILKNVTGMVKSGELLALMGASGAGKTTLLNVLTHRNQGNLKITGDRSVNNMPVGPDTLTACSAYIQQDDICNLANFLTKLYHYYHRLIVGTLTVREHLNFQANLRMHKHIPHKERMARVEEVIQELGLTKCAKTLIGTPMTVKGISGGEKKRLAFASEVLTDPPLMLCDEPTSGLDSFMAANIIQVLKNMAKKGKTIICTIHQPSSDVFALFDRLYLLAEGRTAFLGDTKDAISFFANQGYQCPMNFNPADFFILTLAIQPGLEIETREKAAKICDQFAESTFAQEFNEDLNKNLAKKEDEHLKREIALMKGSPYKASWISQFKALVWRSCLQVVRDPMLLKVRTIQSIAFGLLLGLIFFGQELDAEGVMNINGGLFLYLTSMTFLNFFSIINVFCAELPIFLREHFNGMYRTDVYFFGRIVSELPLQIFLPLIFTSIYYWMVGFNEDFFRFLTTCGIVLLVANTAAAFGYFISSISNTMEMAMAMGPMFFVPLMIFGGFFMNSDSVPVYFVWIKYISWFYYGNEALAINQWSNIEHIKCDLNATIVCPPNGQVVLETLSFNEDNFLRDILLLATLMVFYLVLAFIALLSKTYRKK